MDFGYFGKRIFHSRGHFETSRGSILGLCGRYIVAEEYCYHLSLPSPHLWSSRSISHFFIPHTSYHGFLLLIVHTHYHQRSSISFLPLTRKESRRCLATKLVLCSWPSVNTYHPRSIWQNLHTRAATFTCIFIDLLLIQYNGWGFKAKKEDVLYTYPLHLFLSLLFIHIISFFLAYINHLDSLLASIIPNQ